MYTFKFLRFAILIAPFLSACGSVATPTAQIPATSQPTSIPQPTATTPPTATQLPTIAPSATLAPTATSEPTATSLPPLITPAPGQIEALDMQAVDGELKRGFAKGFFNGNYAYFIPYSWWQASTPDKVVRVELKNFTPTGTSVLDLEVNTGYGLFNSFTDGQYAYFQGSAGSMARLDLQNFNSKGLSWFSQKSNMGTRLQDLEFSGGFTDTNYAYFVSGFGLWRVDLKNFNKDNFEYLDINSVDKTTYLFGGCTNGRYAFFANHIYGDYVRRGRPSVTDTKIVRIDLQNFTAGGVTVLDLAEVNKNMMTLYGWFCTTDYFYIAPNVSSKITRIDTKNFTSSGVTTLDLSEIDPRLYGYVSAFTDGKYGYFLPHAVKSGDYYKGTGKIARLDLSNFTAEGVTWLDLSRLDTTWNNFIDGMSDGTFLYLEPGYDAYHDIKQNTSVVRISLDYAGWAK